LTSGEPASVARRVFSFGPFRLLPAQQLLLDGETRVRVGSRALELLAALVEHAGELVAKSDLMARAWPDTVVEEGSLKVHIAALRRVLGEGQSGRRYVATVSGRGYRFVAPVELVEPDTPQVRGNATAERTHNLPASPTRTIGRADTIDTLMNEVRQQRIVTVVGPGGIGKTTVALAAAESLVAAHEHGARFVDLSPVSDPQFVPSALASALGLTIHSKDLLPALIAYLRDRQLLIVLDGSDHVIEAVAPLVEQVVSGAPGVHILTTSREPLRVKGERVHRLAPLENPPHSARLMAAEALQFSAVQLFVERAAASVEGFELSDADAPIVAAICRKLEGIALAIELAATRIDAFGLRELSTLLDDRIRLLNQGMRTAQPRHRSLAAALEWSYGYLPEGERVILRRLSVFAGPFNLESASAVATDNSMTGRDVVDGVENLVAKSLVSADVSGAVVQYRLLDTTRVYALQKLTESGERADFVRRHAEHHRDLFERAAPQWKVKPAAEWQADYGRKIDDVRNALNWAFSAEGDVAVGVALTVAAIPLWMQLSLLDECRMYIEKALATGRPADRDQMKLYTGLGAALLYTRGPLPETDVVWTRALRIAERLSESAYQLRVLWGLSIYRVYVGEYRSALWFARRFRSVAAKKGDSADQLSCDRLLATAQHYLGDQTRARRQLDRTISQYVIPVDSSHIGRFQFDQRVAARSTLSHILWLQGFPDQAVHTAQGALDAAQATGHALSLYNALGHAACPVALYIGDWVAADRLLAMLLDHLAKHGLTVWNALSRCLQGTLLVKRGDAAGVPLLRSAIDELREMRFGLRYSSYLGALAQGLGAAGQLTEAHKVIEEALDWCEGSEERWYFAELLRTKGELFQLEGSATSVNTAEDNYLQALECARRQGAMSWELRAATSLAQLCHQHGRTEGAYELLSSVHDRFTEGFETLDLRTARAQIDAFRLALGMS
jgi:predicted ATPase/DNA-binding winged helix-turn-helix (wHTH) protein